MAFVWVFVGGGIGACFRYGFSLVLTPLVPSHWFVAATFTSNVLACLCLGLWNAMANQQPSYFSPQVFLLLSTGFCGGLSTFSTFISENYQLISNQSIAQAVLYTIISSVVGFGAFLLGLKLIS